MIIYGKALHYLAGMKNALPNTPRVGNAPAMHSLYPIILQKSTDRSLPSGRMSRLASALVVIASLSACSSMSTSGPTVRQVRKSAEQAAESAFPYTLTPLNVEAVKKVGAQKSLGVFQLEALARIAVSDRADLIRPGDTLSISVFEVGIGLFSSNSSPAAIAADPTRTPTASTQSFAIQVREDGMLDLPYIGKIEAAGTYPEALADKIRARLGRLSESPAVTVAIADSLRNTAYIGGAVSRAGRYRLTSARERLLDVISLAGGSPIDGNDLQVSLVRGEYTIAVPLNQISAGDVANLAILPGDRITLEKVRRSFTVFGASDRVALVPFEGRSVSLAEALAQAGGPSDWRANPRGVYLFRIEKSEDGQARAMVYQINMLEPQSYFLAQMFPMRDKDVILFANSSASLTHKLFSLLSQLFNPLVTVRAATQ